MIGRVVQVLCGIIANIGGLTATAQEIVEADIQLSWTCVESWDSFGSPNNTRFQVDLIDEILDAGFPAPIDTNLDVIGIGVPEMMTATQGTSWLREAQVNISDDVSGDGVAITVHLAEEFPGAVTGSLPLTILSDLMLEPPLTLLVGDGTIDVEFYESFQDGFGDIEAIHQIVTIDLRIRYTAVSTPPRPAVEAAPAPQIESTPSARNDLATADIDIVFTGDWGSAGPLGDASNDRRVVNLFDEILSDQSLPPAARGSISVTGIGWSGLVSNSQAMDSQLYDGRIGLSPEFSSVPPLPIVAAPHPSDLGQGPSPVTGLPVVEFTDQTCGPFVYANGPMSLPDDTLRFEFFEEISQGAAGIETLHNGGFVVTLRVEYTIAPPPAPPTFSTGRYDVIGTTFGINGAILNQAFTTVQGAESMSGGGSTGSGPVGASIGVSFSVDRRPDGSLRMTASGSTGTSNGCVDPDYFASIQMTTDQPITVTLNGEYSVDVVDPASEISFSGGSAGIIGPGTFSFFIDFDSNSTSSFDYELLLNPLIPTPVPSPAQQAARTDLDIFMIDPSTSSVSVSSEVRSHGSSLDSEFESVSIVDNSGQTPSARASRTNASVSSTASVTTTLRRLNGDYIIRFDQLSLLSQTCVSDATSAASFADVDISFTLTEESLLGITGDVDFLEVTSNGGSFDGLFGSGEAATLPADDYRLLISSSIFHSFDSAPSELRLANVSVIVAPSNGYDFFEFIDQDDDNRGTIFDLLEYLRLVDAGDWRPTDIDGDRDLDVTDVRLFVEQLENRDRAMQAED